MRVAIISCGPSNELFFNDWFEEVIGVNSAVERFECDIWCASDHNIFMDYVPKIGSLWGVFTRGIIKPEFRETDPETDQRLVKRTIPERTYRILKSLRHWNKSDYEFNGFRGDHNNVHNLWKRFTVGSALMLAYMLGATEIVCYGCDMEGEEDWKGEPGRRPSDRNAVRWELEWEMWNLIVGWLTERNVSVERIVRCPTSASA